MNLPHTVSDFMPGDPAHFHEVPAPSVAPPLVGDANPRLREIANIIDRARRQCGCKALDAMVSLSPDEVERIYAIAAGREAHDA